MTTMTTMTSIRVKPERGRVSRRVSGVRRGRRGTASGGSGEGLAGATAGMVAVRGEGKKVGASPAPRRHSVGKDWYTVSNNPHT